MVLLLRIRPVGDKGGSWFLERSDSVHPGSKATDKAEAFVHAQRLADDHDSILLIVNSTWDRPEELWAAKAGKWRQLPLAKAKGW